MDATGLPLRASGRWIGDLTRTDAAAILASWLFSCSLILETKLITKLSIRCHTWPIGS
jgi:hypothetical protein